MDGKQKGICRTDQILTKNKRSEERKRIMKKKSERNRQIYEKHVKGVSVVSLSAEYGISEKTVEDIINKTRQRSQGFREDKLMEDAEGKKKELDRIRKIRVGDVVKVRHNTVDAMGYKCTKVLTGAVIYKDDTIVAVQGEFYRESFSVFDLASDLMEYIPS